ncbi:PIN domain-containing protein [Halorientalis pallida]|uniref:Type II toxin-antitoxin system VapC family toxin n=1 Tax=Halorientalis pallida TaxID=2479928 RepID=A0A498L9L5_9EURY|nr:PIN domain-containing protein [Halorientalis pallida]RXK51873.1 type II toxin-antitoxin system VapC family toxin [Halorientalis pallida]
MILDTSVLLDLMRDDSAAVERIRELESAGVPQRLSAMTLYELHWGLGYSDRSAEERAEIEAIVDSRTLYDVTPEILRKTGRIGGGLRRDGRPLDDPGDEIIGATGIVHDESVLTGNPDDFRRIDGLSVVTY